MDRLLSMRAFCRVAVLGSFSRASAELGMSNAVTSRLVADLEKHLRTRLLNRSTRNVNLTEAGQEYFQRCQSILEQIDETEAAALDLDAQPSGRLRMLVGFAEGMFVLARHLPEFHKKYPNVTLEVELAEQVVDIVERQFDLAVQPQPYIYSNSVVVRELMSTRVILCASPAYVAESGMPMEPEDLADRDCLTFSDSKSVRDSWLLKSADRQVRVYPHYVLMSNNLILILETIRAGLGVGLVFENVVRNELESGALVRVLPDYDVDALSYFIVYPSRKHLPAKVRVMVEFLFGIFERKH